MAVLFPKEKLDGTSLFLRMPSPLSLSQTYKIGKIKGPQIFMFLVQERQNDPNAFARSQSQRVGLPMIQWVAWLTPLREPPWGPPFDCQEVLQA